MNQTNKFKIHIFRTIDSLSWIESNQVIWIEKFANSNPTQTKL